ncbi:LuxR family transcriptional regulator [Nocardioides sp. YIM 152315]|uniref:ATP-binding protein n=1 Tax=Nocardioides sp. YIM 152315 TaxID=3031760 RepID=UPI0023DC7F94|nr:LuxR family transcriptional regulator [Nocardioides sp. YIM 152315]MDF1605080.1 LuxR C-terminal-related transcriptional regulator [Nocardioides sp. YIM 152315]
MLVGRHEDQRTLDALLAGARLGHSGVLVISGEAGIGKSALLGYAVDEARGFRVLRVTGTESERDLPFAGLAQLLRPIVERVDLLPAPQAHALSVALALEEGREVDRFAVSAAALGLITAEDNPIGIVVDDAHLVDRPSAEALTFIGRRLLADAVFLLAAVRPGESQVWSQSGLPELALGRLGPDAAAELVAAVAAEPLARDQVTRIAELAAGNPLALRTLAAAPEALAATPDGGPVPVPAMVVDAFARQLDRLDPPALHALRVAAVVGNDLAVVARVCAPAGVGALGRSEELGLVAVAGDRVEFTHPLVRSAVYSGIPAEQRRRIHAAAADAIPAADPDRRAWHLSAAAFGPDEEVAALLDDVGRRAERRAAYAVAASARERAARLSGSDPARAARFLAAGEAAWLAGEDARATVLVDAAIRHGSAPDLRAGAHTLVGLVAARSGQLARARDLLLAAAEEAEGSAPAEALQLYAEVVDICWYLLDIVGSAAAADRAQRLLDARAAAGLPPDRAEAVASIAVGMARIFEGGAGADAIRHGVDTLTALPASARPTRSAWEMIGPLYLREFGAGRELVLQALEQRRAVAALGTLPHLLFHLARNDATSERWAQAEAAYGEAVALARECGQATELGMSLAGLTCLLARQGRTEECRSVAAEATEVARGRQLHVVTAWVEFARAELELSLGDVASAVDGFTRLKEFLTERGVLDPDLSPVPELVESLVRSGDHERARTSAGSFLGRAERKALPWSLARAARVQAMLAPDDLADERFREALAWHGATPDRFEAARTRLLYGERLRRARRRTEAREQLRAALDDFDRLGAHRWADLALAELQASGQTARRRETGPVVDLTARELQIGLLLADGRTTREAAAALFLSPKTVEYHLRHIYTKLDIASRAELAERLRDRPD